MASLEQEITPVHRAALLGTSRGEMKYLFRPDHSPVLALYRPVPAFYREIWNDKMQAFDEHQEVNPATLLFKKLFTNDYRISENVLDSVPKQSLVLSWVQQTRLDQNLAVLKEAHVILNLTPLLDGRGSSLGTKPIAAGSQSKMRPIVRCQHPLDLEREPSALHRERSPQLQTSEQQRQCGGWSADYRCEIRPLQ
jgi:hypothetical protein